MKSAQAFANGDANRHRESMVFDWHKAAELIRDAKPEVARAGLQSDWEWTGGTIFADGEPDHDSYTYLASTWATPELEMDGEIVPCFKMQSEVPEWYSGTKWPDSAVAILKA
jgi:hypothetical protein